MAEGRSRIMTSPPSCSRIDVDKWPTFKATLCDRQFHVVTAKLSLAFLLS